MLWETVNLKIAQGTTDAMEYLAGKIKEKLDTPYPPASSPGDPPHKRTGHLQASVDWTVSGSGGKVIVTAPYAAQLEFGTARMAPRPFVRQTILDEQANMLQIIADANK